jgi:hypothetical protein
VGKRLDNCGRELAFVLLPRADVDFLTFSHFLIVSASYIRVS